MMHKIADIKREPSPGMAELSSTLREFIAKLRNAVKLDIPVGYQDETGFHYGVKPAEKDIKWPPDW